MAPCSIYGTALNLWHCTNKSFTFTLCTSFIIL
jgi:hypothetical protein